MKYLLIALVLVMQTVEPPRHDKYKDDDAAICWNPATSGTMGKRREADPHAHKCSCKLMCVIGSDDRIIDEQEDSTCEMYCTKERCLCHAEEACEMPGH